MGDFSKYKIKDYKYWSVFLSENQNYLGRCVIWCNREEALDLADATKEEREELFLILNELRAVSKKVFGADWMNYAFLGNVVRHLHCHFIPRYAKPQVFEGVNFTDEFYGKNYQTDSSFVCPPEVIDKIILKIKESIG